MGVMIKVYKSMGCVFFSLFCCIIIFIIVLVLFKVCNCFLYLSNKMK